MSSRVVPATQGPAGDRRPIVPSPPSLTRGQRFRATRTWLLLRNLIGWVLILAAFVAGPLVPGPGGLPLFLVGFALISFPGKRRLTARVLRGRPVRLRPGPFVLICTGAALTVPVLLTLVVRHRPGLLPRVRAGTSALRPAAAAALYLIAAALVWMLVRLTPHALNVLLRFTAKGRRKFRPWLRRHRIRLLPPRWRHRHPYEPGRGPFRLKDEILGFSRKGRHGN